MREGNSLRSSDSRFLPGRSVPEPCRDESSAHGRMLGPQFCSMTVYK